MRNFLIKITSTFFYVGYLPLIPGTFGSAAGLVLFYLVRKDQFLQLWLMLCCLGLGFSFSGSAERIFAKKDAPFIVIDEVSGMLISLIFIPYDLKLMIIAFLLFRILDTLKPYPAGWLQRLKGSRGIMIDDIVAGIYTNIILQLALRLASLRA
jgi:phosphatidylglycerophosphatase A